MRDESLGCVTSALHIGHWGKEIGNRTIQQSTKKSYQFLSLYEPFVDFMEMKDVMAG